MFATQVPHLPLVGACRFLRAPPLAMIFNVLMGTPPA
jgi:hypothetical protein